MLLSLLFLLSVCIQSVSCNGKTKIHTIIITFAITRSSYSISDFVRSLDFPQLTLIAPGSPTTTRYSGPLTSPSSPQPEPISPHHGHQYTSIIDFVKSIDRRYGQWTTMDGWMDGVIETGWGNAFQWDQYLSMAMLHLRFGHIYGNAKINII